MIRVSLDLENPEDLQIARAQWKFAEGLVPGEPNEGLTARLSGSPARLADYDDSKWDVCDNVQEGRSSGLTFGWFRITITLPEQVQGLDIRGNRVFFETCIDDYGEIYGRYQDEQDNLQLIEVRQTPLYLPPEPMGGTAQLFG